MTDAAGRVRSRYDYLPFGEEIRAGIGGRTQSQGYSQPDVVRQRFTGHERDEETGLDYMKARYYSSMHGRFASVDPSSRSIKLENPQSWNRYNYCLNNPLLYIDMNGKWPTKIHNLILKTAFNSLHPEKLAKIQQGSAAVDRDLRNPKKLIHENTLIEKLAFRHAMTPATRVREIGLESARAEAKGNAGDFVTTNMNKAKKLNEESREATTYFAKDALRASSYYSFGEAVHTITDNVSPAHRDFQVFDNSALAMPTGVACWSIEQYIHSDQEDREPTETEMNEMVDTLRKYYRQVYGEMAYREAVSANARAETEARQRKK